MNTVSVELDRSVLLEKTALADYTTNYTDPNTNVANIIGYSMNTAKPYFFAYRIYTTELTATDKVQNAFADLAKWYKLDMKLYESLTAEKRAELAVEIVNYATENGIGLENDADKRDALQEELNKNALDKIYDTLTDQDSSAEAVAFKDVVRYVEADITSVLAIPAAMRTPIYEAVAALNPTQQETLSAVQRTIDGAVSNILANYEGLLPESSLTYKDLYVKQTLPL